MFSDLSRRTPRKKTVRFKAAAALTTVVTCLLVPLLYYSGRPGTSYIQQRGHSAMLTRKDLLVVMTATTER